MTQPQEQKGPGLKSLDSYAAYLALRHSQDQEAIAAELALALYPLWSIQRFTELDRSTPLWLSAALPVVKTSYLQSQRVAAVFSDNVRLASLATEDPLPMILPNVENPTSVPSSRFSMTPRLSTTSSGTRTATSSSTRQPSSGLQVVKFDDFPLSDVATSLTIQGNYQIKSDMPAPEEEVMYNGLKNSSGAAIRQAMNGGRNAVDNVMKYDRKVIGYARVTDANPCYFCALLAARGTVYGKGSFIDSDAKFVDNPNGANDVPDDYVKIAKVHDHCRCQLRPVYAKSQAMDADAKFYAKQWKDLNKRMPNADNARLIAAWKEEYKPFARPEPNVSDLRNDLQERETALANAGFAPFSTQREWVAAQIDQLAS